jgi:hypothetical protein
VHRELRRLAHRELRRERRGHGLQTMARVDEALTAEDAVGALGVAVTTVERDWSTARPRPATRDGRRGR